MLKHMLSGGGGIGIKGDSWVATLGGSGDDYGRSVAVGPDGSLYIGGSTESCVVSDFADSVFAKFSSSGTLQWKINFGGHIYNDIFSIAVAHDGSVYASGNIGGYFLLIKFNESGALQWQKTLGDFNSGSGNSVAVGPDGSLYVCGYTESAGAGRSDLLIAKITDDVIEQYIVVYNSNFTLKDASLTVRDSSYRDQTSSLSASNSGLSLFSSSNTAKDANLTLTKY